MASVTENFEGQQIITFLRREGIVAPGDKTTLSPLAGDGSSRIFYRIRTAGDRSYCGVLPNSTKRPDAMAEARAASFIGTHLKKRGIEVPGVHAFDPESGLVLFEDLGETHLYDVLEEEKQHKGEKAWEELLETYREIIEMLLFMQISGSVRFDRKWCWETPRYDKKLMLEKESGYFLDAFCRGLLNMGDPAAGLADEFKKLAGRAACQPAIYFMHRDFQSRNLMVADGEIRIIDFQGGRLGPLGYDLASLLIDPYARIPAEMQLLLLEHYLNQLCTYGLDGRAFLKGYKSLALQRNLQVLGAFAFLANKRQKTFFRQFIPPAARSLHQLLAGPAGDDYPKLLRLSEKIMATLEKQSRGGFPSAENR
jgi:aminoglycoside/choline kinase family phosphotransferase